MDRAGTAARRALAIALGVLMVVGGIPLGPGGAQTLDTAEQAVAEPTPACVGSAGTASDDGSKPGGSFRVGVGETDVTWHTNPDRLRQANDSLPADPLTFEGVHSRVKAKAVYVEAEEPTVLVRAGILIVTTDLYEAIAQRVEEEVGIPREQVVVAATHTHSTTTPMYLHAAHGALYKNNDPRLFDFVADRVADAVREAKLDAQPAELDVGEGTVTNTAFNRRHTARELHGERPFANEAPFTDPSLGVLRFDHARTGDPIAVVMNYGVHPVTLIDSPLVSSDLVGWAEHKVEQRLTGPSSEADPMAIWFTGAQGDQDPVYVRYSYPEAEWTANQFAEETIEVYQQLDPEPVVDAGVCSKLIPLPDSETELPSTGLAGPRTPVYAPAPVLIPSYARLHAVRLATAEASTALMSWPGEPIADIEAHLDQAAASLGYDHAFVLGLSNNWAGYWLTPEEYDRGGYERTLHFYGRESASYVEQHLVDLVEAQAGGEAPEKEPLTVRARADRAEIAALARATITAGPALERAHGDAPDKPVSIRDEPDPIPRPGVTWFTWRGGSPERAVDWIPTVEVQRKTDDGWRTVADDDSGEILLYQDTPEPRDHRWTAVWEAQPDTPDGTYRFAVEGRQQATATATRYNLISSTFDVVGCLCLDAAPLEVTELGNGTYRLTTNASYPEAPPTGDSAGEAPPVADTGFRWYPGKVTGGHAQVVVWSDGQLVDRVRLPYRSQPATVDHTVTVHDVSGQDLPVTIDKQADLGSFSDTIEAPTNATFDLVGLRDEHGNWALTG